MVDAGRVRDIVESAVKRRFPKIYVVRINVREDTDEDGDKILEIKVVFDAAESDFDPKELRSLPREIIPKLSALATKPGFPILSFISKSDFGKMKPETA
jgi:hypothetical protein